MNRVWEPGAMPTALRRHVLFIKSGMSTRRRHGTQQLMVLDYRFCSSKVNTSTRGGGLKCEPLKADCCEPPVAARLASPAHLVQPASLSLASARCLSRPLSRGAPLVPRRAEIDPEARSRGYSLFPPSGHLAFDVPAYIRWRAHMRNHAGLHPVPYLAGSKTTSVSVKLWESPGLAGGLPLLLIRPAACWGR